MISSRLIAYFRAFRISMLSKGAVFVCIGIVIAEPETGRILHTERTIAPGDAELYDEPYFGGIDYAPQNFGDRTFWLPSRFYAHDADNRGRMFAVYSNCHRYTGELKILPNMPAPDPSEPR